MSKTKQVGGEVDMEVDVEKTRKKFDACRMNLSLALTEREDEIELLLMSLLAREHILLVGNPGVGKSMLLNGLCDWMRASKFSILMTPFTTPEEVFGPYSIQSLKKDQYKRITRDRLPEVELAFIDEVGR